MSPFVGSMNESEIGAGNKGDRCHTGFARMDRRMQKNMMGYFVNRMEHKDQEVRF